MRASPRRAAARSLVLPLLPVPLALLVLLAAAGTPSPARAAGGDLVWMFQGIEDVLCADEIADVDGDGVPDVVVETYDAGATGDHLWCLSGAAPGPLAVPIWSVRPLGGPSNSGGYGDECVHVAPDLSGDGFPDVLLGTAWGARTAFVLDGTDGSTVWSFDTYVDSPPNPPQSGWVYSMVHVPDTDFDKVPDVFFVCGSDNDGVYHMSGDSGDLLWVRDLGDGVQSAVALGDASGDGLADAAFGVGDNADAVWVMKGGAQGSPVVWSAPMPGSVLALARIEDLSGDGVDDVVVGTWASTIFAFDAATGDTLWAKAPYSGALTMRLEVLDDVDADGVQDIAVGSWDDRATVISGATGDRIWSKPTGGDVWAIDRVEDVTGDGINDVVAGSFDHFVYLLDGTDGTELWSFDTGNRLYWVMGTSDLTGNGVPDVFAGSQKLSGPGGQGYLLEGGETATGVDLPLRAEAARAPGGIEVRLAGARGIERCWVERLDGAPGATPAARAFEDAIVAAVRAGELTTREAIAARALDPQTTWTRVSDRELAVVGGGATWLDGGVETGRTVSYRFALLVDGTRVGYSPAVTVTAGDGRGRIDPPRIDAWPNPVATDGVGIRFRLPVAGRWRLDVVDATGRRVATVDSRESPGGEIATRWDGRDADGAPVPGGTYFLRLEGPGFVASGKVTRLR